MRDLYNREQTLENLLLKLKASDSISDNNRKKILDFYNQIQAEGLSVARVNKYLANLMKLSEMLKMDFTKAKKDDIIKLVGKIEKNKDWADWTKQGYRIMLKRFYKWLRDSDDYPPEVKWIKSKLKTNHSIMPEQIPTIEEVFKMVKVAENPRDKALLLVLYESGCRIGEIMNLQVKDIQFDNDGAWFMVDGKTGQRRIRLVKGYGSAEALRIWLDHHPNKDNPESYLWVSLASNSLFQPTGYRGIYEALKALGKKAGITKKVNPHSFRHSRATYIANGVLNEWQMKQMFGWSPNSNMASVYVHLSGRDIDKALVERFGKVENQEQRNDLMAQLNKLPQESIDQIAEILKRAGLK